LQQLGNAVNCTIKNKGLKAYLALDPELALGPEAVLRFSAALQPPHYSLNTAPTTLGTNTIKLMHIQDLTRK
jgi:hypothetical protein